MGRGNEKETSSPVPVSPQQMPAWRTTPERTQTWKGSLNSSTSNTKATMCTQDEAQAIGKPRGVPGRNPTKNSSQLVRSSTTGTWCAAQRTTRTESRMMGNYHVRFGGQLCLTLLLYLMDKKPTFLSTMQTHNCMVKEDEFQERLKSYSVYLKRNLLFNSTSSANVYDEQERSTIRR